MSKKNLLLSAVGITALGLSSAVFADNFSNPNQDVYVGIQGGYGDTHWNDANGTLLVTNSSNQIIGTHSLRFKDTGFAGRVFAGYDFNQFLALETGYTYFPKADVKVDGTKVNTISTQGVDLLGKITVPVVDNFGLYAKAGPGYLHSSVEHAVPGIKSSTNNIDLVYGLGAQYAFNQHLVADVSFTRYNGNHKTDSSKFQPNADLYAVGLAYKFNI